MKKLNLLWAFIVGFILFSCSSDDDSSPQDKSKSEKKLVQVIHYGEDDAQKHIENITYVGDKVSVIKNEKDQIINEYKYNANNQLTQSIENLYTGEGDAYSLTFTEKSEITYGADGKISKVKTTYDGHDNSPVTTVNDTYTYQGNTIIRKIDDEDNTQVEYTLTNDLITKIKVYIKDELKDDLTFEYDAEGNCIAGHGPIDDEDFSEDVNFKVTYGEKIKYPIFNQISNTSVIRDEPNFFKIRQGLAYYQGNRYGIKSEWSLKDHPNDMETYDYTFDKDGYPIKAVFNDKTNPIPYIIEYYWE